MAHAGEEIELISSYYIIKFKSSGFNNNNTRHTKEWKSMFHLKEQTTTTKNRNCSWKMSDSWSSQALKQLS